MSLPLKKGGSANGQIYINGEIKNLHAPDRDNANMPANPPDHPPPAAIPPAIALDSQLNITATQRIEVSSDIIYQCDPTIANNNAQGAACQGQNNLPTVLGIMSINDDIVVGDPAPDDIYLWGSYLTGQPGSGNGLAVENFRNRGAQGTMRLFGGLIQSSDQFRGTWGGGGLASGYIETFDFDQRLASGQVAPPNFPVSGTFEVQNIKPLKLEFKEF